MSDTIAEHREPRGDDAPDYRRMSLTELLRRIAHQCDRRALDEFHAHRTIFRWEGRDPMMFVEYLGALREAELKHKDVPTAYSLVVDRAYDLTLAKFLNLPRRSKQKPGKTEKKQRLKQKGPDCRYYFMACMKALDEKLASRDGIGAVEEEALAARMLQGLVKRHFRLSLKECLRGADNSLTRYFWKVKGGTLCLLMPADISGKEKREWLEQNVPSPDASRSGERERVQNVIDKRLHHAKLLAMTSEAMVSADPGDRAAFPEIAFKDLVEAVAQEKSDALSRQRPAVRALGKRRLKALIRRIFRDLSNDTYKDTDVARHFGLSKATLSRFAGSRWSEKGASKSAIPDLWRNTARVLACHPDFAEAAQDPRFRERLQDILGEDDSHD